MRGLVTYSITISCLAIILFLPLLVYAQEHGKVSDRTAAPPFNSINKEGLFKPYVALELWATYSMGEERGDSKYANREDIFFRRLRVGGSGIPYSWLKYNFQLHLDRLGEDNYASTKGSYNGIDIWNAYITAKLLKKSDLINVHAGYYWAAISREFNTSAWSQGSFDRTKANWYLRKFVTGKGNGIESGIGLGGLKNFEHIGIAYRIGTFGPQAYTSSKYASRLYTGHLLLSFGDPEQSAYKYRLSGNQWQKRSGITLGIGGSTQSTGKLTDTTFFGSSTAYGTDILINYKGARIDGEYFLLHRTAPDLNDFEGKEWHLRIGYSFIIADKYLEPVITYDNYEGEGSKSLYNYIGDNTTLDLGVNWYINKDKLKLSMHYVIQQGSVSSNTGDYLGTACQFKL